MNPLENGLHFWKKNASGHFKPGLGTILSDIVL
jgi:hypothetical protein